MQRMLLPVGMVVALGVQAAPVRAEGDLRGEIEAANRELERCYREGRPGDLAAKYTDDAVMAGPNGYRAQGREAIDAYWMGGRDPVDWRLEVFEVEALGEAGARQTGRSTLRSRGADGEERTSIVLFEVKWLRDASGAWRIASDAWWDPGVDYAPAIERVLAADGAAAAERNRAPIEGPMHEAVSAYVRAMDAFDYAGAPGDFAEAMRAHREVWARLIALLGERADERGEMHAVFDRLTAPGEPDAPAFRGLLDGVWSTWGEVTRTAARHGVAT